MWRKTDEAMSRVLKSAFDDTLPPGFELHAQQLLSPNGDGPFQGWNGTAGTTLLSRCLL